MNDAAICTRRGFDGVIDEPCEAAADGLGSLEVEAGDELVEVALQMLGPKGAVMGAQ